MRAHGPSAYQGGCRCRVCRDGEAARKRRGRGSVSLPEFRLQLPRGPEVFFDRAAEGACRGMDTNLFFPDGPISKDSPPMLACARCPVRSECLEHALANNERYGILGGTSEKERRRIKRRRAKGRAA